MECLRELRIKHEYSQLYMAKELHISKAYYCQIENNQRRLSYELAIKIAKLFNLRPDDIFYNEFNNKTELC